MCECWWGLLDGVNVAFTSVFARYVDIEPAELRRVTDVSYLGYVHGTRAALDHMLPRDHGAIVQVGSTLAYRGIPLQSAYCGTKHAIQGFNESLRCELLHDKSRVRNTMVQLPAQRREYWCGESTAATLIANAVDRAAGHDHGAHGTFDSRSYAHSPPAWLSRHHGLTAAAVGVLAPGAARLLRD